MKEFFDFAHALQVSLKNLQLYSEEHPRSMEALKGMEEACARMLAHRERLYVAGSRGKLFLEGTPVDPTLQASALMRQLEERNLSGFVINRGVQPEELRAFLKILILKPHAVEERGGGAQMLASEEVKHIRFPHVRYEEVLEGEEVVPIGGPQGEGGLFKVVDTKDIPLQVVVKNLLIPLLRSAHNTSGQEEGGFGDSSAGSFGGLGGLASLVVGGGGSLAGGGGGSSVGGGSMGGGAESFKGRGFLFGEGGTTGSESSSGPSVLGPAGGQAGFEFVGDGSSSPSFANGGGVPGAFAGSEGSSSGFGLGLGDGGSGGLGGKWFDSFGGSGGSSTGVEQLAALEMRVAGLNLEQEKLAEAMSQTIDELDSEEQAALLMALPHLQSGALRASLEPLAPELFTRVAIGLAAKGINSIDDFTVLVDKLLRVVPQRDRGLELLRGKLEDFGMTREQLDELVEILGWDDLVVEQKIAKLVSGRQIFKLPPGKPQAFLHQLLTQGHHAEVLQILEHYAKGLFADSTPLRLKVADGFVQIASWAKDPGLPRELESFIERVLLTHFMRETDQKVQHRAADALDGLLVHWAVSGSVERSYRDLLKLQAGVGALSSTLPWKREEFDGLIERLGRPERMAEFIPILYHRDQDALVNDMLTFLAFLGDRAAGALLSALAKEEDKYNRARLVRALRTVGKPALQHLRAALESKTWFLVRNALTILTDLASSDMVEDIARTLRHDDGRVRRAAVRALARIGGISTENALAEALPTNDAETQSDILNALATMKAESTVNAIAEFMKGRSRGDDKMRERAAEVLGQIRSARAIPYLADVVRRKGLLGGQETPELRVSAARALISIGTDEARLVVRKAIDSEPRGTVRDLLEKAFARRSPA